MQIPLHTQNPEVIATPASLPARGSVVLFEGLNIGSDSLDSLALELSRMNLLVYRGNLTENSNPALKRSELAEGQWSEDVQSTLAFVRQQNPTGPLVAIGYSLGAVALIEHVTHQRSPRIDSLILLAPPVRLRPSALLFQSLISLLPRSLNFPSLAPERTRARSFTPARHYAELFRIIEAIQAPESPDSLRHPPTLLLQSERDEFVSLVKTEAWMSSLGLTSWRVEEVHPHAPRCSRFDHLIIDQESLGAAEWERMLGLIREHISSAI